MSYRQALILLLIAITGYASLSLLFPRTHPASKVGYRIDRTSAIELARAKAVQVGVDARGWRAGVETETQSNSISYLKSQPRAEFIPLLPPIIAQVKLNDPATKRQFAADISSEGRIIEYTISNLAAPGTKITPAPNETVRKVAEDALREITGDLYPQFVLKPISAVNSENQRLIWEMEVAGETRVKLAATVDVVGESVKRVSIEPSFSRAFTDEISRKRGPLSSISIGFPIIVALSLLLAIIFYVRHIVQKEIRHRSTLIFMAVIFVMATIWGINGEIFEDIYTDFTAAAPFKSVMLGAFFALLLTSLINLLFISPFFFFFASGYPYSSRFPKNPINSIELLVRGRFRARQIGRSLTAGMALGWIFPILPLAIIASGLIANVELRADAISDEFNARWPLLTPPTVATIVTLYLIFTLLVFIYPLLRTLLHRPLLVRALIFLIGVGCLVITTTFRAPVRAAVISAIISMAVIEWLLLRFDLLTILTALIAGDFALKVCAYAAQPSAGLQASAWRGWEMLAVIILVAAVIAVKGDELTADEANLVWATDEQRANRGDRERLKAEFDVARRAQQQMLPAAPPSRPGIEIAAICRPAREVGGDLYDFLDLPDGRLGVVVADVSGKGVPASLYMTLTKGLLASVSETTSDPGSILREVNRHLYVACRKKMFVTLLLAVIDPQGKTLTYARAGHNPPVWRRKSTSETALLRAPGLGLGLNSGDIFKRTLKVESRQLEAQDILILYSDGITEAMNDKREEYGEERLMAVADRLDGVSAEKIRDEVLADVGAFLGKTPPQDDQTLVVVRIL
jgi:sigma-B regulation protein RsbU (phosphoserine phosphatase)